MSVSAMGWLQSSLGFDITGEWNRLVHLTVGGLQYVCLRKTFRDTDVVLCKMVIEDAFPRGEDGSLIIDRDGQTFRHVLNYLRTGELLLPDGFDEWDLLLSDAAAYGMPGLERAIAAHPAYQTRQLHRALPASVYLRFDYAPPPSPTGAAGDAAAAPSPAVAAVHLVPPLPMLSVDPDTGALRHHGRDVSSVDEAVCILLGQYDMRVESWDRAPAASTVFLTRRPRE
uniref:Potassium channel tetramerisation-type BTB domain-containing protein n=1 Tax=Neobodo designis TaxID=312471 RepID=A0A7S1M9X8_NEODS|mmetsp:Transcript_36751/g.113347  ORF Transcript_36751/g.113347 Transcript_36751/m.113347 type:complete len:227 (+) Transcript_36751:107-787(+)